MNYLATLYDKDVFPNKVFPTVTDWTIRKTVKIILQNNEGKIALVTNPIHNCLLLPGGGVGDNEELYAAANRECMEEVNYSIEPMSVVGVTQEYRAREGKKYETYCVLAKTKGKVEKDLRTEEEKKNEISSSWYAPDEVVKIFESQETRLKEGKINFYNTGFNIVRDGFFIKELLNKINS